MIIRRYGFGRGYGWGGYRRPLIGRFGVGRYRAGFRSPFGLRFRTPSFGRVGFRRVGVPGYRWSRFGYGRHGYSPFYNRFLRFGHRGVFPRYRWGGYFPGVAAPAPDVSAQAQAP